VVEDSDYLFFDGFVTNIDEEKTKENKKELLKELKGKEEAEKLENKKDTQLESAIGVLKGILLNNKK